ncbi:MAG: hypothetical protein D6690_09595 [Nitrospirae bacterium]|nr:MAG: hypothetical protein D6690_09595 [Nitrospirota bacterium]
MVYPAHHQSATQVAQDKAHCRAWAEQEAGSTPVEDTLTDAGVGAAVGALGGAAAGAIIGAAAGSPGTGAAVGAAVGGLGGAGYAGTKAYASNDDAYNRAYAACMKARNYIVN